MDFPTLFGKNCVGCHGVDGKNGPARILNDPLYLAIIPKEALKQVVVHGRRGTPMPAWARSEGGPLTDKQIDALVDGIYANWAKPVNLNAAPAYAGGETSGDVTRGKKLFGRSCFMCHGKGAPVGSVTDVSYLSVASNQVLRTAIIVGRPDLGMPDYQHLNLGRALSDQDITDMVAYMVSLRPAYAEARMTGGSAQPTVGAHVNESGGGQSGTTTSGNEGTGNGPGSARHEQTSGHKGKGSNSQRGVTPKETEK